MTVVVRAPELAEGIGGVQPITYATEDLTRRWADGLANVPQKLSL